jgi:uncharacterized iron-regulated membrane protein
VKLWPAKRRRASVVRHALLLAHRYVGLVLVPFLTLLGLTGSIITFNSELERAISPQLFAAPRPEQKPLSLAALAQRAETLAPEARLRYLILRPGQAIARMEARPSPSGEASAIDFDQLFLDPFNGAELGRRREGDLSQGLINLIPFVYRLHREFAAGHTGVFILGIASLVWTVDCLFALYLTLPLTSVQFWRRWARSWRIKKSKSSFRLHFDFHRAGSLWSWLLLIIFAWSGVMMNLDPVYDFVTRGLFDYEPFSKTIASLSPHPNESPRLTWREAETIGVRIMSEQAAKRGFSLGRPDSIGYVRSLGVFTYGAASGLDIRRRSSDTSVWFDGDNGELRQIFFPTSEHTGNTVSSWLWALHFGDVENFTPYRLLVCLLGLWVVGLSLTGVAVWLFKRDARNSARHFRPARRLRAEH